MNTNTTHPLIPNSQEYILFKKYFSLHSEDIDTSKYTTNCFEIELPQDYFNVLSARLSDINLPPNIFNFSQALGNTTFYFDISLNGMNVSLSTSITDGQYSNGNDLFSYVITGMNSAVNTYIGETNYNNFSYSTVNNISTIKNTTDKYPTSSFTLINKSASSTNFPIPNNCTNVLGCNTGYLPSTTGTLYYAMGYTGSLTPSVLSNDTTYYSASATNLQSFDTYTYIYMEIEGLNNIDELVPYGQNQYTRTNSGNSGIVNSAFAKIPFNNQDILSLGPYVRIIYPNYYYFNPPAERIRKLKIKFRFHNNVLVNFNGGSYTFLLEFTLYDNQQLRKYNLSRPVVLI
jgi:hypothetical protein